MTTLDLPFSAMSILDDVSRSIKSLFEILKPNQPHVAPRQEPREFKIPKSPDSLVAHWVSSLETTTVRGIVIKGAMFYLGSELKIRTGGTEPSLINPLMHTSSVNDSLNIKPTLSYAAFTPFQREQYLKWLSSGCVARAPDAFLKLYIYGIEHRALLDVPDNVIELIELRAELIRISAIHHAIEPIARTLIEYLSGKILDLSDINHISDHMEYCSIEHILGTYLAHDRAIPITVLSKFFYEHNIVKQSKTVANILPVVNKAIIHHLSSCDTNLFTTTFTYFDVSYVATSPNLKNTSFIHTLKSMDFLSSRSNVVTVNTLLLNIIESLHPFAKFIASNPGAQNTFEAITLLPEYLYPEQFSISLKNLRFEVDSSSGVELPLSNIFSIFNGNNVLTKDKYNKLIKLLNRVNIGIEPSTYKNNIDMNHQVVLYDISGVDELNDDYLLAELFIDLSVWCSNKDFNVNDSILVTHLEQLGTPVGKCNQLVALAKYHKLQNKNIVGLKSRLRALSLEDRTTLATLFVSMNKVANDITPAEIKILEAVFALFDLDNNVLYSLLHSDRNVNSSLELDHNVIMSLQKETSSVAQLLHSVFNDDSSSDSDITILNSEMNAASVSDTTQVVKSVFDIKGLGKQASALVLHLSSKSNWLRSELESYAVDNLFMLDGVLEQINETCFDLYDEPLIDDGLNLTINQDIMEKLLND